MSFLFEILSGLIAAVLLYIFGMYQGKKREEEKRKERELEVAKEVLDVRPSTDVDAALKRLSRNGKLSAVQSEPPEHQLKLPF